MSDPKLIETCSCGAKLYTTTVSGSGQARERRLFHEAHAACRGEAPNPAQKDGSA